MKYLSKEELRRSVDRFSRNPQIRQGIASLERFIGYDIDWFHPKTEEISLESGKRYAVVEDETKKVVLEAEKLADIAKEFCTHQSKVSICMNTGKLLKGKYIIVRCTNV